MSNGHITCQMRSTRATERDLARLGQDPRSAASLTATLDHLMAVDVFAELLEQEMIAAAPGGTIDFKDMAARILRRMGEAQR